MKPSTQWLFEAPATWETHQAMASSRSSLLLAEEEWEAAPIKITNFTPAEEKALRITTTFETGRAFGFGGLTGNFDGMGLSFGLLQWNFGSGSLQPLLIEFSQQYPQQFALVFGTDAARLQQVLRQSKEAQLAFARSINNAKNRIMEPWFTYFRKLEENSAFQQIQLKHVRPRLKKAADYAQQFQLRSERGFALMFDIVTQSGPAWLTCSRKACQARLPLIEQRRAASQQQLGRSLTERELLTIIANVVADTSSPRWREDVRKRKMTIVTGVGHVHGRNFNLERDFGLADQPWQPGKSPMPLHGINLPSGQVSGAKSFQQQPSALAEAVIAFASTQVGVMENPLGSNSGPEVNGYLKAVGLPPGHYWCAAFTYFCYQKAAEKLGRPNPHIKTAGVLNHWNKAGTKPKVVRVTKAQALANPMLVKPGCLFIIDHGKGKGHTGIVKEVANNGILVTIEGNTNNDGSRNGIGVFQRKRSISKINGFIDYSAF